jgi:O-antigen/teichoic acid export membrane protein
MTDTDGPEPDRGASQPVDARPREPQQPRSVHRQLTVNSASNAIRHMVSLVVTFFLTPFIVRTLGNEAYGFWVVLLSFVGYAGVLELGVQTAVIKLVGQHRGSQDRQKLAELVTAALLFFLAVGLLTALCVVFMLPPLAPRIIRDFGTFEGIKPLSLIIAVNVLILFANYLFTGVMFGSQHYHAKNLIDISAWLLNAVLLVIFLPHHGLVVLAASKAGSDLLALLATVVLCRYSLPEISFTSGHVKPSSFGELLRFGGKLFASATATRVSNYTQPVIISSQLSAAATAFYAIPGRLVDYSKQIGWALSTGFMPFFSELDGRQERALIRTFYLRYSRYLLLCTLPILALVFVYGRNFLAIWVGPEYAEQGHVTLYFLTAAALADGLQPLVWRLFTGIGRLDLLVVTAVAASLVSIALGFLLARPFGISGVALSVLLTTAIAQVILFWNANRYLELSAWHHLLEVHARPLLVALGFAASAWVIARLLGSNSYGAMAAGSCLSLLIYVPLGYLSLRSFERNKVLSVLRLRSSGR